MVELTLRQLTLAERRRRHLEQVAKLTDQVRLVVKPRFESETDPGRRTPKRENPTETRDARVVFRRHPEVLLKEAAEMPIAEPDATRSRGNVPRTVIEGPHGAEDLGLARSRSLCGTEPLEEGRLDSHDRAGQVARGE